MHWLAILFAVVVAFFLGMYARENNFLGSFDWWH